MKLAQLVPDFLKEKPVPSSAYADIAEQVLQPGVNQAALSGPLEALEEHLAILVAAETEARASHERAMENLNAYINGLREKVEAHQRSIEALYAKATPKLSI
jgi:hypothetical protein